MGRGINTREKKGGGLRKISRLTKRPEEIFGGSETKHKKTTASTLPGVEKEGIHGVVLNLLDKTNRKREGVTQIGKNSEKPGAPERRD